MSAEVLKRRLHQRDVWRRALPTPMPAVASWLALHEASFFQLVSYILECLSKSLCLRTPTGSFRRICVSVREVIGSLEEVSANILWLSCTKGQT